MKYLTDEQLKQMIDDVKKSKLETKSKRLNLLIYPSLHKDMIKLAKMTQDSVNNLIIKILTDCRNANIEMVKKYDEIFGKE